MNVQKYADLTFGIRDQALAVLHMVAGYELDSEYDNSVHVETAPWYNCRECGVLFSVTVRGQSQHIAVFEHRNSDDLCALCWEEPVRLNPPTIDTSAELAYHGQDKWYATYKVGWGRIGEMSRWVRETINAYVRKATEPGYQPKKR